MLSREGVYVEEKCVSMAEEVERLGFRKPRPRFLRWGEEPVRVGLGPIREERGSEDVEDERRLGRWLWVYFSGLGF